jgi:hypothetical protein
VVVQSLWALTAFRDRFNRLGPASPLPPSQEEEEGEEEEDQEAAERVRVALRQVFDGLAAAASGEERGNGVVSVDALREALSGMDGTEEREGGEQRRRRRRRSNKFLAGHMDDAAEAMEAILSCLAKGT